MRWSIRNQILVPLITIQIVAIATIAAWSAIAATRQSAAQIELRLNDVVGALNHANFPPTPSVLKRLHDLTGAHFASRTAGGAIIASSLSHVANAPGLDLAATARGGAISLSSSPIVSVAGSRYFLAAARAGPGWDDQQILVFFPEEAWRKARWQAAMPPILLGAVAMVVIIAVTGPIAYGIGRRVRAVERGVARIAEGVFQDVPVTGAGDEVDELAESVNRMSRQLQSMTATIQQTERSRLLAQLAAGLAHQLRNSLTGARLSVQLHAKRHPPPNGDESLTVALRQLAMTEEQVKGLLAMGRGATRRRTAFDLVELARDVASLIRPSCEHAGVRLDGLAKSERIVVIGDEAGVRAAVVNLALNAVEAAGRGGRVGLEVLGEPDRATVSVGDSGPGPASELEQRLFEPFVTSKAEGVGLGLAIAQQVAADHAGKLTWSRSGGTTRFVLELARTTPDAVEVA